MFKKIFQLFKLIATRGRLSTKQARTVRHMSAQVLKRARKTTIGRVLSRSIYKSSNYKNFSAWTNKFKLFNIAEVKERGLVTAEMAKQFVDPQKAIIFKAMASGTKSRWGSLLSRLGTPFKATAIRFGRAFMGWSKLKKAIFIGSMSAISSAALTYVLYKWFGNNGGDTDIDVAEPNGLADDMLTDMANGISTVNPYSDVCTDDELVALFANILKRDQQGKINNRDYGDLYRIFKRLYLVDDDSLVASCSTLSHIAALNDMNLNRSDVDTFGSGIVRAFRDWDSPELHEDDLLCYLRFVTQNGYDPFI